MTVRELIVALLEVQNLDQKAVWGQDEDEIGHIEEQGEFNQVVLSEGPGTRPRPDQEMSLMEWYKLQGSVEDRLRSGKPDK